MSDPVARLNVALEGRYAIERELGEGGMDDIWEPEGFTPMTELLTPDFADYIASSCD